MLLSVYWGTHKCPNSVCMERLTQAATPEEAEPIGQVEMLTGTTQATRADGVYFSPRLDHDKQCMCVIVGADELGRKELLAIADGYPQFRPLLGDKRKSFSGDWRSACSQGTKSLRDSLLGQTVRAAGGSHQ